MQRQVGRVLAAVVAVGAMVSGCGGVDQPATAVVVGDTTVSLETVQSRLDFALKVIAPEDLQRVGAPAVARDLVTSEVIHDLLVRQGSAAGITVPDAAIDTYITDQGGVDALLKGSALDLPGLRGRVRDNLTAVELAKRTVGGLSVTADLLAATSREDADAKAKTLAAGGPAADALFDDPQTSQQGIVYSAAANPQIAASVVFGTPAGGTGYFQPSAQQATWIVFHVAKRRTDAPVDQAAVNSISQDELITIGQRLLQPAAHEVGITVNPRYGVWDPVRMRVVAADQTGGAVLPAAPGR